MSIKFSNKYNKLAATFLLLAPLSTVQAAAPIFVENSVLSNELEFLFNPKNGNSEHLSITVNSQNSIYTSYQNAIASADIVNVAQFSNGHVTSLGEQSTIATANTYSQLRVNPIDDSLVLAFVEDSNLIVRTSADGQTWQQAASTSVTATSKSVKMEVDSQGTPYILHTGSDNNTTIYELVGSSLTTVYGPVATKSNNNFTVSADIAIDSKDQLHFVYRDFAESSSKNKTLLVRWDVNDGEQTPLVTSAAPTAAYMRVAFDSHDNLHLFNVGYDANAGGGVYKLEGTDVSDITWQQVGDKNFGFTFAEGHATAPTTGTGSPVVDLAFGSNDVPYLAFQQYNNATATKKHAQLATLVNGVWTEVTYDLATATKDGSNPDIANHNSIDIAIDSYDRPILMLRSSGTGHNSYGYGLRVNLLPGNDTLNFTINEGDLGVGQVTADDADGDDITLSLTGADAELFDIEQTNGAISFKQVAEIADANEIYNVIVNATAAGNTTSTTLQITLINDTSNDIPDTDNDGLLDDVDPDIDGDDVLNADDAFPFDATESIDSDNDGVGDNADPYPLDETISKIENIEAATAPVFIETSVAKNELEFLFNPQNGNSEHLSMAINSQNSIYTSYQNSVGSADTVNVAQYSNGQVTSLGEQSTVATANTYSQLRVNPIDDSLLLAFVENSILVVRTSTDGQTWQQAASTAVSATSKSVKMAVDSQGIPYILHTGSDNKSTIYKLIGSSLTIVYGPVATKSNNSFTVAADIAIDSKDQLNFVYRDAATGDNLNKTLLVRWDVNDGKQTLLVTSTPPTAAYMSIAFDNNDNLHLFNVGYNAAAGGSVYKLDGSDTLDSTWELVGNENFTYSLAEDYSAGTVASPSIDIEIDQNNSIYVAFQQSNNSTAAKKPMQLAKLIDNIWTEVPYDLAANGKVDADVNFASHSFVNIAFDAYQRLHVSYRAGGSGHNAYPYVLRENKIITSKTLSFTITEGNVLVADLTVIDNQGDAISLSLSGADADLFDIDQSTGEISFKQEQLLNGSNATYNFIVNATAAGETTSVNVEIALINNIDNDAQGFDVTPSIVMLNKFSKVNNEFGGDNQIITISNTNVKPLIIGTIGQNNFFVTDDTCSGITMIENELCSFTVQTFDPAEIESDVTVNHGNITIPSNNTDSPTFNLYVVLGEDDESQLTTSETVQEKAQRKTPPIVKNIVVTNDGTDYTVSFDLDGYYSDYQAGFAFFDCTTPITNTTCATSLTNKLASSQALFDNAKGITQGNFSYSYNGDVTTSSKLTYSATVDLSEHQVANELVLRFYYKASIDITLGNRWISAIIPGGQGYTPVDGLGRKIIAPTSN